MSGQQINPRLIQALTGRELESIPSSPTYSDLEGKYVKTIIMRKPFIKPVFPKNEVMLKCKHCSRKGKYDVGFISINIPEKKEQMGTDHLQFTGYFRCKHCNTAGEWEDSQDLLLLEMSALLAPELVKDRCQIGKNRLYDGSEHKFATDAEEHFLNKIKENPKDAFLWNQSACIIKGSRPELAITAFEKSIMIDPNQMESHYSIGELLVQAGDAEEAAYHLHQMMLTAEDYHIMDAESLRDLLSNGIRSAFQSLLHPRERFLFYRPQKYCWRLEKNWIHTEKNLSQG